MLSFDFITSKDFRLSLEADYREMEHCLAGSAWKSVQVLAGSMVEALLVEYLTSTTNADRSAKDPLKMDLVEAIETCKAELVLSSRTADLCSVVRAYRNLIHPGRMVRLGEPAPNKDSATVALSLVSMITSELAVARRKVAGLTAEQVLAKLRKDSNSLAILKHLLEETNESQCERLLLEMIPGAHRQVGAFDDPSEEETNRLQLAFHVAFDFVPETIRRKVGAKFVRILKEEDGTYVEWYTDAFFKPAQLGFIDERARPMIVEYIFGRVGRVHTVASMRMVEGIAPFVPISDVHKWVDPFVRLVTSSTVKENAKNAASYYFSLDFQNTTTEFDDAVTKRLKHWTEFKTIASMPERLTAVAELIDLVENRLAW